MEFKTAIDRMADDARKQAEVIFARRRPALDAIKLVEENARLRNDNERLTQTNAKLRRIVYAFGEA